MMEQDAIRFEQKDNGLFVCGYPELKDCKGVLLGDGMAFFFGELGYESVMSFSFSSREIYRCGFL